MTRRWLTGNDPRVARRYLVWSVVVAVVVLVGSVLGGGSGLEQTLFVGVALGGVTLATVQAHRNAGVLVSVVAVSVPLLAYFVAALVGLLNVPAVEGPGWALATALFLGVVLGTVGFVVGFGSRVVRYHLGQ